MVEQLSIIIPTLNEERYLPRLLESLTPMWAVSAMSVLSTPDTHTYCSSMPMR
jgi:hypothetical protein